MSPSIRAHLAVSPCVAAALLLQITAAVAQPSQEQQNALRSNCRSDFMSHCSSVKPGGIEALQCLQRNVAKLSPGCQSAVNALKPPAAPPQQVTAPAAPAASPPAAPATQPATRARPAAAPSAPAASRAQRPATKQQTATAPPAPATAASPMPTAEQQSAIKFTCRRDFIVNCRGVTPGGPDALTCLQRHAATLSQDCKTSIAAIGEAAPAAAGTSAEAAPPPRLRPVGPLRRGIRDRMMER